MSQILWIGCLESDEEFKRKAKKGYDLASAQVSQKNLLYGIEEVSNIVCDSINGSVLPHYPIYKDRTIKPVIWKHKSDAVDISVGYKNDKYINRVNCKNAMIKVADEWCKTRYKGGDLILFVYSMRSAPMATACRIKDKIPCAKIYLIVTDLPEFMDLGQSRVKAALKKIDWKCIKKMQRRMDGFILYAEEMAKYLEIPQDKWILMETAVRLVDQNSPMYSGVYETGYNKRKREWKRVRSRKIGKWFATAFLYIVIFCLVEQMMGTIEESFLATTVNIKLNGIVSAILDTLCFGLLGSWVSEKFGFVDVLESVKNLGTGIKDIYRIHSAPKQIAYRRNELDGDRKRKQD